MGLFEHSLICLQLSSEIPIDLVVTIEVHVVPAVRNPQYDLVVLMHLSSEGSLGIMPGVPSAPQRHFNRHSSQTEVGASPCRLHPMRGRWSAHQQRRRGFEGQSGSHEIEAQGRAHFQFVMKALAARALQDVSQNAQETPGLGTCHPSES